VRFLVDANLSPLVTEWLRSNGHDAVHAFELGLAAARDSEILEHAARGGRIVLTSDLDFGDIAALGGGSAWVCIIRLRSNRTARIIARLERALPQPAPVLERAAVVIIEQARLRVRRLPLGE
jgi:predicted nuclease of predicted toxin-antitoxin system